MKGVKGPAILSPTKAEIVAMLFLTGHNLQSKGLELTACTVVHTICGEFNC